ncbi:MAG: hypothetical protein ACI85O_001201 [Saprospiraceae bacterium]
MSKKRFTDGLESLFGISEDGNLPEELPLLIETEVKVVTKTNAKKARGRSSKNFTSDLDSLFEDTLENVIEETKSEYQQGNKLDKKRKQRRPVSGLDALIRRTLESGETEVSYDKRKRVTFVFEKSKVEKLKRIAKSQKVYLKDILGDIVQDYLQQYEKEGGTFN